MLSTAFCPLLSFYIEFYIHKLLAERPTLEYVSHRLAVVVWSLVYSGCLQSRWLGSSSEHQQSLQSMQLYKPNVCTQPVGGREGEGREGGRGEGPGVVETTAIQLSLRLTYPPPGSTICDFASRFWSSLMAMKWQAGLLR